MNWKSLFNNSKSDNNTSPDLSSLPPTSEVLEQFFQQYNCKFRRRDEDGKSMFEFTFQGGNFYALANIALKGIEVNCTNIIERPVEKLNIVKGLCNHFNASNLLFKLTYFTNTEKNTVNVNLSYFTFPYWFDEFANTLALCFNMQRDFETELEKFENSISADADPDAEIHNRQREVFLLRQLEILHQEQDPESTQIDNENPITLDDFIADAIGLEDYVIDAVKIICGDKIREINPLQAPEYSLIEAIVDTDAKPPRFRDQAAVILISYHEHQSELTQHITITLSAADTDGASLYILASASAPLPPADRENAVYADTERDEYTSLMLAYYPSTPKQKLQEFDYMLGEIKIKQRDGKPLDENEQLLVDTLDPNVQYCLYWGHKHFINANYYQALRYLRNAFQGIRTRYFDLTEDELNTFNEICYYIAFCYEELGQHRNALFYLGYIAATGNVRYTTEMVHALTNAKDYRIFSYTDEVAKSISQQYDIKSDDIPEHIDELLRLMRRNRAYALIDFGRLDEAEAAFTDMLNDPDEADYAIDELAYIKQLREQQAAENDDESPNPDPRSPRTPKRPKKPNK